MREPRIELSRACQQRCPFCDVAERLDKRPVPVDEVRAAIDAARAAGATGVVLSGGEPTLSGALFPAIAYAHGLGLRTTLRTNGRLLADPAKVGRLGASELDAVVIALHGATPATHVALTGGDALAHTQAVAALRACAARFATTLATVLTPTNLAEIPALVALAAEVGAAFELRPARPEGAARRNRDLLPDADVALAGWRMARSACARAGVRFVPRGFHTWGLLDGPAPAEPAALTDDVHALLAAGLHDRSMLAGLRIGSAAALDALAAARGVPPADLPALLAARRLPLADVPLAHGGLGTLPTPDDLDARLGPAPALPGPLPTDAVVAVVVPPDADRLTAISTLPALVEALRQRGVDARLISPFRAVWAPDVFAPAAVIGALGRVTGLWKREVDPRPADPEDPALDAAARAALPARLVERLQLDGVDLVVTWGWKAATLVAAAAPHLPRVVIDADLLQGFSGLGPADVVLSPRPWRARAYVAAGVQLAQVRFRGLPVHPAHLVQAKPSTSRTVLVGGPVDPALLAAAPAGTLLRGLPGVDAVADRVPEGAHALRQALGDARLLWLPTPAGQEPDPRLLALALAAGLPVLASETPAAADTLAPGTGWWVRPDDPDAHAARLVAALADDEAVTRAGLAARAHAARTAVDALARELADGARAARCVPTHGERGPYAPW